MNPALTDCVKNWQFLVQLSGSIVAIVVACLAYLFAKKNMRYETKIRLDRFRKEKVLEAGMAFWGLLSYTTQSENQLSIIRWERDKDSSNTRYFINTNNAHEFITKLNIINYEKGHGLFLGSETRDQFYEYRNILYGFLLATKDSRETEVLATNEEMIQRMKQIHDKAIILLKEEMKS